MRQYLENGRALTFASSRLSCFISLGINVGTFSVSLKIFGAQTWEFEKTRVEALPVVTQR